jgi:hypothetical protein
MLGWYYEKYMSGGWWPWPILRGHHLCLEELRKPHHSLFWGLKLRSPKCEALLLSNIQSILTDQTILYEFTFMLFNNMLYQLQGYVALNGMR